MLYKYQSELFKLEEKFSYKSKVHKSQLICAIGMIVLLGSLLLLDYRIVPIFLGIVFVILIVWRLLLVLIALWQRTDKPPGGRRPSCDGEIYSILVPVYREAAMMPQLVACLNRLDWPKAQLDIQILCERDDPGTYAAALDYAGFSHIRIVIVPAGGPKTKPNALNFGLSQARGKYICVYDAEDRPHPEQLRAAANLLSDATRRPACVQAPLVHHAPYTTWIGRHWGLEYAVQFGVVLPALVRLGLPILIGGTSNHFRTDYLRQLGGWDAWNVTEDADLAVRLARYGFRFEMVDLPTYEPAPHRLAIWLKQRSRWIKGFMQTWLVLMRTPYRAGCQIGWGKFVVLQMSLAGAILAALAYLPIQLWVLACLIHPDLHVGTLGWVVLNMGALVGVISDCVAPGTPLTQRMVIISTRPFYWSLQSLSAYSALWELARAPHYWAKTPHIPDV